MSVTERAKEFCEGAFAPFGVKLDPYIETITELLQGQADETRSDIAAVLREAADIEARKGPDGDSDMIYWMRQIAGVLSIPREELIHVGLLELANQVIAEQQSSPKSL